jgi:hypothetical protein
MTSGHGGKKEMTLERKWRRREQNGKEQNVEGVLQRLRQSRSVHLQPSSCSKGTVVINDPRQTITPWIFGRIIEADAATSFTTARNTVDSMAFWTFGMSSCIIHSSGNNYRRYFHDLIIFFTILCHESTP